MLPLDFLFRRLLGYMIVISWLAMSPVTITWRNAVTLHWPSVSEHAVPPTVTRDAVDGGLGNVITLIVNLPPPLS
jgi:hypothetical protein